MKLIPCNTCGSEKFKFLFEKESSLKEKFRVVECCDCNLVQVNPQPDFSEVAKYYSDDYFTKRTDRGYDDYYSEKIKSEISRVFRLNLEDLKFFEWEKILPQTKFTIDVGCAAGYFVDYLKQRGWNAKGIEIAKGPSEFGKKTLGLEIEQCDFLEWDKSYTQSFDLITLWASIEHLHKPKETLQKIHSHLKPGGRVIISTCRYGRLAKYFGKNWRYMNVPEHLYYYSMDGLIELTESIGFSLISKISYGSGMTSKKGAGTFFKIGKFFADKFVKLFNQGDMMALSFAKSNG
ncbi:MAG: class I SAM-dependent methyltransferase [Leptospiraceae bacterium]|nr:class I SAM-dependent methyltransferase [Leptospiraceae bacterium]